MLVAIAALLAVIVAFGRAEGRRDREERVEGMRSALAVTGEDLRSNLAGYRLAGALNCLLYSPAGRPLGVELCFGSSGRLVEALDRNRDGTSIWSFRARPDSAPLRFPPRLLLERFHELGALLDVPVDAGELPTGFTDRGPIVPPPDE